MSTLPKSIFNFFMAEFGKKLDSSHQFTHDMLIDLNERVNKLDKGKGVDHTYSTSNLTPSSPAPTSTVNVEFGMPPNYFAGQSPLPVTVRPSAAKPVRPVASTGQTAASAAGAVRPVP